MNNEIALQSHMHANNDIIEYIYKNKILSNIIKNVGYKENKINLQDLEQDLYLELLNLKDDILVKLYESNNLNYYLSRLVVNNIVSKNSRYYYKYKKNNYDFLDETEE